ncbi:MAG TPA: bifunctional DNA primase/polymerase, partial [Nitrososphaeraceae archaeon]
MTNSDYFYRISDVDFNEAADHWRYDIGVNIIPANTKKKRPIVKWEEWQDRPIPEELHNRWKSSELFANGMAIIPGKVWHNKELSNANYYLAGIDADNRKALEEFLTKNGKTKTLLELAALTLVEVHKEEIKDENSNVISIDYADRAHIIFYTPRPIRSKGSDKNRLGEEIESNEIPALEIKGLGEYGILYCSPSIHAGGFPYEILGTDKPLVLTESQTDELEQHLDNICNKYGIKYLSTTVSEAGGIAGKAIEPIEELFKPGHKILVGHNRHEDLLRVMESLITKNKDILSLDEIKEIARRHNTNKFYEEALPDFEFERQWNDAVRFITRKHKESDDLYKDVPFGKSIIKQSQRQQLDGEKVSEEDFEAELIAKYNFKTLTDTRDILYYDRNKGIFVQNGEVIIEAAAENRGYKNKDVSETLGHIRRRTFTNREDFDSNIEWLATSNCMVNLLTGEAAAFSPDFLTTISIPVKYDVSNSAIGEIADFF